MTEDIESLKKYFQVELLDKDYEPVTYGFSYRVFNVTADEVSIYIEGDKNIENGEYAKVNVDSNYGILTEESVNPPQRLKSHSVTVKLDYESTADEEIEDQYEELTGSTNVDECV